MKRIARFFYGWNHMILSSKLWNDNMVSTK